MKLQTKILLQVTAIISAVTAVTAYIEMNTQIRDNTALEDAFRTSQSSNLFAGLENSLWNYDKMGADAGVSGMLDPKAIKQILVFDSGGTVFTGSRLNEETKQYETVDQAPDISETLKDPVREATKIAADKFGPPKQLSRDIRRITAALYFEADGQLKHVGHMVVDYSIAEGVRRAKAATTRLIISGIFSGLVMVGLLLVSTRREIIKPLSKLSDASAKIAAGDFSNKVEAISKDEIGDLANNFDSMRLKVKDFTENLQAMVDARTREVLAGKKKIQNILIHIEQGILTFGPDQKIDDEFSEFVLRLFNKPKDQIIGASVTELLLNGAQIGANEKDQFLAGLGSILGESVISYETNNDSLARELKVRVGGQDRILGLDWTPMVGDDGKEVVDKLMLSIRDLTKQRELELKIAEERAANDILMARVGEIIRIGRKKAEDAIQNAAERTQLTLKLIADPSKSDPHAVFRELHTIKGNARVLKLKSMVDASHNAESMVGEWRSGVKIDHAELRQLVVTLGEVVAAYQKTITDVMGSGSSGAQQGSLLTAVSSILPEIQENLVSQGFNMSKIHVVDDIGTWKPETLKVISDTLVHGLTNAMDHGYILPKSRGQMLGDVNIEVRATKTDGLVRVEIADEGAGADIAKLRSLAKEKNIAFDEKSPFDVLFSDGFSTAKNVTESSGRGVGLSAIKDITRQAGGVVTMRQNKPRGMILSIVVPELQSGQAGFKKSA